MKKNKIWKNILTGFWGQLITIVLGLIIPRIMIVSYGSDTNGLISTITQIFTYMALLEAGIGQAAKNAFYKQIAEHNRNGISYVASLSRRYYRKITILYFLGVVILCIILPFLLKTEVDRVTAAIFIFLEGMSGVVSFYFIQTSTVLLTADGKGYVNNTITVINRILAYGVKMIMAYAGMNIALLQVVYFLLTVAKTVVYRMYFNKNYGWIDYNAAPVNAKLKDRNAFIVSELAWTIFSSTDMIVLSMFVSTSMSSVYSVYNMVFSNLNVLLNTIYLSTNYVLGQTFHSDRKKYIDMHDMFNSVFFGGMTILMCIAYILIIPFIKLYTNGITDIEYVYNYLPVMFCLVQIISWSRYISGNLTALAGYAKKTSVVSVIEAAINVILSCALVPYFGIYGVLAATVIALPVKVIYCTYLTDKVILKRSYRNSVLILGINFLMFILIVLVNEQISLSIDSYFEFFVWGIIITIIISVVGVILNGIVNPHMILNIRSRIKERGKK